MQHRLVRAGWVGAILWFVGAGVALADYNATVKTPRGSRVSVIVMTWELSADEVASMNEYWSDAYPRATRVGSCSRRYNCHSYAWYAQRATSVWINSPSKYWSDGSYSYYAASYPRAGDKVYYPGGTSGSHSAVSQGSGTMVSKWGQAPLMRHNITYGPYEDMRTFYSFKRNP
ncbi:MAG: hypothetical protein HZA54_19815 [Planctomycetes bacterium]|nr:hypothetical protein [Planctomycetota bacterium]